MTVSLRILVLSLAYIPGMTAKAMALKSQLEVAFTVDKADCEGEGGIRVRRRRSR